jgi:hypothetical protein
LIWDFPLGDVSTFNRFVSTLNASISVAVSYGQDTWRITPADAEPWPRWEIYTPETVIAKGNGGMANPSRASSGSPAMVPTA